MAYTAITTSVTTEIGQVRLLILDRDTTAPVFLDDDITAFLTLEVGVKRAAALALETIASDEALVQKVQTTQGLSTNGAATAKALMDRAQLLRGQAQADDERSEGGAFDIAEMPESVFSQRERIRKEWQRGAE